MKQNHQNHSKNSTGIPTTRKSRPAMSPEARENQLIALAYNLVEQRLLDGTATSQETVHFLRLGSQKERLEEKMLENQIELAKAKTQNLKTMEHIEELYQQAMDSMRSYQGDYVDDSRNGSEN